MTSHFLIFNFSQFAMNDSYIYDFSLQSRKAMRFNSTFPRTFRSPLAFVCILPDLSNQNRTENAAKIFKYSFFYTKWCQLVIFEHQNVVTTSLPRLIFERTKRSRNDHSGTQCITVASCCVLPLHDESNL